MLVYLSMRGALSINRKGAMWQIIGFSLTQILLTHQTLDLDKFVKVSHQVCFFPTDEEGIVTHY